MYSLAQIAKITGGTLFYTTHPNPKLRVSTLFYDSRTIANPVKGLFVAIDTPARQGHTFVADAYSKGVTIFMVNGFLPSYKKLPNAAFIVVKNTLAALQALATHHRSRFNIPVVGITGSNGKTVVKEWLYQIVQPTLTVVRSPKSYNSQIGVPLSVWQLNSKHQAAIFEAGISAPAEMQNLADIIKPTIGILTNIGQAHQENFESLTAKAIEKAALFATVTTLITCTDEVQLKPIVKHYKALGKKLFTWGRDKDASVQLLQHHKHQQTQTIGYSYKHKQYSFSIPFGDEASLQNAMHCLCAALLLGLKPNEINTRMPLLQPVAMRLELKQGINNTTIINDSYNADIEGLEVALNFLTRQKQQPGKIVVLSDLMQTGLAPKALYQKVAKLIANAKPTRFIGIGKAIAQHKALFGANAEFYPSTHSFITKFNPDQFGNAAILLKGSRVFEFEQIEKLLQQKSHQTVLEINLRAIAANLGYFRSLLKPKTKVMAMVKAFSYGSGSFEVANLLQHQRVDYLAVAYADEGVHLRQNGITLPIMVMNPEQQGFAAMVEYNLEPIIYSHKLLTDFTEYLQSLQNSPKAYPVHIELETGMNRLGFEGNDLVALAQKLNAGNHCKVMSVFSHLAAADEPKHDGFTNQQITLFNQYTKTLQTALGYGFIKHILNSAGIYRFTKAQHDMVRLGVGLYGVGVDPTEQKHLQAVSRLRSVVSQIKHVTKGDSVGYSRKGLVTKAMVIATIPIGYADGIPRLLSNGKGSFYLHGRLCPIVGNVCMDMTMIDITPIANQTTEGDEVEIFGPHHRIFQFAQALGTIPYEVLTNISTRVKRVYFEE